MAPKVSIEITAATQDAVTGIKKVDGALGGLSGSTKTAGLSLTDIKSGLALAGDAFRLVEGAVKSVIDPTIEYAKQVRDLGRAIGATPEEASKLIQAADDMQVSVGSLEAGLKAAIRKGVKPTIEGLGELADKYNSIQDPIARTKFLMDNFGRSGADLAPLMEQGAAGIAALGDEAERTGLVMSQQGVNDARQYELAVDSLEDSFMAWKIQIAQGVIPALTAMMKTQSDAILNTREAKAALDGKILSEKDEVQVQELLKYGLTGQAGAIAKARLETIKALDALDAHADALTADAKATTGAAKAGIPFTESLDSIQARLKKQVAAADEAAAAQDRLSDKMVAAGLSGQITGSQQDYLDVIKETSPEIEKLTAQIGKWQAAQGQTYTVVTEATTSLAEYELAQIKAATAAQKLAEYTGDDREELLTLRVAAENAAERVGKLGEGMGITQQFTADYTKKIQEAGGSLDDLNRKQAEAEAQLVKTTSQFVLQQAAGALTGQALLTFAHDTGILNDADYYLALRIQTLTEKYDVNHDGVVTLDEGALAYEKDLANLTLGVIGNTKASAESKGALDGMAEDFGDVEQRAADAAFDTNSLAVAINSLTDKDITITVTTRHVDDYSLAGSTTETRRQSGGPVYGGTPYLVGESGKELFVPRSSGFVMDNADTMRLIRALERGGVGGTDNSALMAMLAGLPAAIATATRDAMLQTMR